MSYDNNKTTERSEKIWVKIIRAGYIPQLGMQGPIPNPIQITRGKAHSMIVAGIDVFEIDPGTRKSRKLTIQNVFGAPKTNTAPNTQPQKQPAQNSSHNKENQNNNSVSFNGVPNNNQKNNRGNGTKDYQKGQKNPTPKQEEAKTDKNEENTTPEKK